MEETWRLLGISGCPTCLVHREELGCMDAGGPSRSMTRAVHVARAARVKFNEGRGHREAALAMLRAEGLIPFHLTMRNPFFLLPHAEFSCFPMDRLHGMYVCRTPTDCSALLIVCVTLLSS